MSDTETHDDPVVVEPVPEVAAAAEPASRADQIDAMLRAWMVDCIHNTVISRDTDAINYLANHALPELSRRIVAIA